VLHALRGTAAGSMFGLRPRLFGFVVATIAAGTPVAAAAAGLLVAGGSTDAGVLAGSAVFFLCALAAELKPLSLDIDNSRVVSLAFVFIVSAQVLFGWSHGLAVGVGAMLVAQLLDRAPRLRLAFNCCVYAIATTASSLVNLARPRLDASVDYLPLTAVVLAEGAIFVAFNVVLVCVAIALVESRKPARVVAEHLRYSGPAFLIMSSMAALAVALWTVEPPLLVLLAGPLLTLGLYQRYARSTRVARLAAATDSLTRLGNHRAFKDAIRAAVDGATEDAPATLCLVDVDNFKRINDMHGHAAGDETLADVAARLALLGGGRAFRLGGDEFALIVDGSADEAAGRIQAIEEALAGRRIPVSISTGIASSPGGAAEVDELQRLADMALYWMKRNGKRRSCIYDASLIERSWPAEIVASAEFDARLRAVENLVRLVDARELKGGEHSEGVSRLVAQVAVLLGVDDQTLEHMRLAARLHDLGKIGIPDRIVHKPAALDPAEAAIMRRHPEIGFELLDGLDVAPVDEWILHHHEHWDGSGYPDGLRGEEIPLGSRVILVADAYHAMTNDRGYRLAMDPAVALAELVRGAGRQFDPAVVKVFVSLMRDDASRRVRTPLAATA
jgi:diguanylate cyclase (GGDEF)-like protein